MYKAIYSVHRSKDYGVTFQNETDKFPPDAVAHWYYVSKDNVKVCSVVGRCVYVVCAHLCLCMHV